MSALYQVGIVGAGFGGIIAAIELLKSGRHSFIIFEKAGDIGGVWRNNIYPGCGCDVRSDFYSIKSQPNPNWSEHFSQRKEILDYLDHVVEKQQLKKYIRFNTEVGEARFLPAEGCWQITDQHFSTCKVKILILATGPFRLPQIPKPDGIEKFKGTSFHSANWDNNLKLESLNVAVIGTGSSSAQIVPAIAGKVKNLYVFQRSPAWVLPKWNGRSSKIKIAAYRRFPALQKISRELNYWFLEWIGLLFFSKRFMHRLITWLAKNKLSKEVKDPLTRQLLTPTYAVGCKRIILSDDFYPAFNLPHVKLITGAIQSVDEHSIVVDNTKFKVDVIVFATGFKVADIEQYIRIIGLEGAELGNQWEQSKPKAFLGINVAGYPNLCFQLGPNSGLYHSSVLHVIESQMVYILQYVALLESRGDHAVIDVKADRQQAYNNQIDHELTKTVWNGCHSWYLNKRGENVVLYPHLTWHYRKHTRKIDPSDYKIITSYKIAEQEMLTSRF
ncbi:MAG: NAD(P)/FAD-dependent oxidoreductase [Chitinophagaceae bacterium]|nr:NAD(P)/FAD-dependent oxidoreductase [Chitinophagaceae bacterium]